ncbi:NADH-quinone oxidoreductase subunit K [Streptomyces sp. MP131-18]|uniref:NADH-quinone oxidoreductase subunit K n=1 Tax=Streptomyces sp. MP131-18 TaxID=1857892 RepID=UPI00097C11A0|nr:NADH-quinone oxidoreductase subunit K [Streptomyces sp. MP131-18]ONK11857.1 Multiple resistance and pH homeostasis protein C [Streptomyces sp. MP131-18]
MKSLDLTMALVVGGLFAAGVHLMLQRSLTRILLGFIVLGHGTNLLLLTTGGADPLPQAMALTAIVITFGITTFLLALAYRSWRLSGHDEVPDDIEDRRIGDVRERADTEPTADVEDDEDEGDDGFGGGPRARGPVGSGDRRGEEGG